MKKGQVYEGLVIRLDYPNKGIVQVTEDGIEKYAIVKNALPGQRISFRVNKKHGDKVEGYLLQVIEKASCETEESCPFAGECGGCLYQGFSYEEQLKIKEEQVIHLLEKYTQQATCDGIKKSPKPTEYRNKMEFSFGDAYKDGPLTLGLHKRGSMFDVLPVTCCRIMDEDYRAILSFTQDFFRERGYSYFHKIRHEGYLRHLLVRKASRTGEILVALVTTSGEENEMLAEYVEGLRGLSLTGTIAGILHLENDSLADAVKCDRAHILYGRDFFEEQILGLSFRISTFSFFQTNSLGAEVLYETVREYVSGKENGATVYDLYSGTGTIAQMLAPAAKKVIGVEIVEDAVEQARENAKKNGLMNCEFIAGDVLKVLDEIREKPDYIILDPPRDGIHPKALQKIISYGVEQMVYISCKASSLARDLEVLTARGYEVTRYGMVDMFPYAGHVETVVLLSREKVDGYVYFD